METLRYWKIKATFAYCSVVARIKSQKTYPESLSVDLDELLGKPRKIRVAIIDDQPFPWKDALEGRGCRVNYFPDYIKPIKQTNQKVKVHDLGSYDIIICDIHGVGSTMFPQVEGIGVIEDLRRKYPLHVIAAYTGNPGAIYSRLKRQDSLDMVFSRDWQVDDFLLNFDELAKIFRSPRHRWNFVRKRLNYLDIGEEKIESFRKSFVESVLLGGMLRTKFKWDAEKTRELVVASSRQPSVDYASLAKLGIGVAQIVKLVNPFS